MDIMPAAKARAEKLGVGNVVVATNSGASVLAAQEAFGPGYQFFAVGNPASAHDRGLCLHTGISDETRRALQAKGITVITRDQSLFQADERTDTGPSLHDAAVRAYADRFHGGRLPLQGGYDIVAMTGHLLAEFFGDGPKVCLEVALMAADSGQLPLDDDCMAIATPKLGFAHAAMILRAARTQDLFSMRLRVKDLLLVPAPDDVWFSNGPLP
ncbi:MAG TPA: hypothetical protein VNE39_22675 [Planctomycetota bacterium]|nr:hypothetical protein [Planctomycetota bacterium]